MFANELAPYQDWVSTERSIVTWVWLASKLQLSRRLAEDSSCTALVEGDTDTDGEALKAGDEDR
jgi:hypothetical protein